MCLLAFDCTRFYPRLSGYPNSRRLPTRKSFFCFLAKSMAAMDEKKRAKSSRNDFARIH